MGENGTGNSREREPVGEGELSRGSTNKGRGASRGVGEPGAGECGSQQGGSEGWGSTIERAQLREHRHERGCTSEGLSVGEQDPAGK